ncbi:uncharacterized protein MONBRDRAFT_34395 [Monosiga brevicollis MX1]|uniref:Hexosyltransferase n=1 Tax=Monosiga brevicollis TaxID=81824 RepID=A9VBE7_MONBE|nr:uncharacterized protein MONBRDRAFT_34395 [Monosiga brevicollis MX1]EDQ85224.1 predicted protein [Monosiga brevicollis MX1]|eukprot:XP_001750049.1 hypothetical protein [Monosiga brevicollis MX1]
MAAATNTMALLGLLLAFGVITLYFNSQLSNMHERINKVEQDSRADSTQVIDTAAYISMLRRVDARLHAHLVAPKPHALRTNCSVNPSLHYEDTGETIPECPPERGYLFNQPTTTRLFSAAYMLSLEGHWEDYRVRRDTFRNQSVYVRRFIGVQGSTRFANDYVQTTSKTSKEPVLGRKFKGKVLLPGEPGYLTPGEQGYLATMRQLLEEALNDPRVTSILVFDDDALLHCNFAEELRKLLSEERCGGLVEAESTGGVLLLGSALWINGTYPERGRWTGGWAQVDHDMEVIRQRTGRSTQCFNVDRKTMGTFGVIYHRQVFAPIIEWTLQADEPFDHLWPHLTSMGFPVRAAYRSLVVQDVRHQSSVDPSRKGQEDFLARAQKHHWDMTQYCDPNTEQPVIPPKKA